MYSVIHHIRSIYSDFNLKLLILGQYKIRFSGLKVANFISSLSISHMERRISMAWPESYIIVYMNNFLLENKNKGNKIPYVLTNLISLPVSIFHIPWPAIYSFLAPGSHHGWPGSSILKIVQFVQLIKNTIPRTIFFYLCYMFSVSDLWI